MFVIVDCSMAPIDEAHTEEKQGEYRQCFIIVGNRNSGKTMLARELAKENPAFVIYDNGSLPLAADVQGPWIIVTQNIQYIPQTLLEASSVKFSVIENDPYAFRTEPLNRCPDMFASRVQLTHAQIIYQIAAQIAARQ